MKVILLDDIGGVGKRYDVKEVADGHARNFLLPRNLVKPATKQNMHWLTRQKEAMEKEIEEDLKRSQELASTLDDLEVGIATKVGAGGQLFESVNAQKIAEALKAMGHDVKKTQVKLEKPIKELGEFPVKIVLSHNLEAEVRVIVSADAAAAPEEE